MLAFSTIPEPFHEAYHVTRLAAFLRPTPLGPLPPVLPIVSVQPAMHASPQGVLIAVATPQAAATSPNRLAQRFSSTESSRRPRAANTINSPGGLT